MKQILRSKKITIHCRNYYKKYVASIVLEDIVQSIQSMPYVYIDSNYSFHRSTVVRAVKEMIWDSVGVYPHRFTSCQRQELNRIRTVLLVNNFFLQLS